MASYFNSGSIRDIQVVTRDDRTEVRFGPMSVHLSPVEVRDLHRQLTNTIEENQ